MSVPSISNHDDDKLVSLFFNERVTYICCEKKETFKVFS